MKMNLLAIAAVPAIFLPAVLMADPPPAGAQALSQIVAAVEAEAGANLAYIKEVEWDDDGYWEVEYRTTDGAKVEIEIDPVSGQRR